MGCFTLTTLNKVNIKGVEYEIGGSGGDEYKSFDIDLDYSDSDEEYFRVYFDFDNTGSNELLIDWAKTVIIDLMTEDGRENGHMAKSISLVVDSGGSIYMKGLNQRNKLLYLESFFGGAFLSNQDSANFLLLEIGTDVVEGREIIYEVFGAHGGTPYFTKARIYYVPVNEYSIFLQAEV